MFKQTERMPVIRPKTKAANIITADSRAETAWKAESNWRSPAGIPFARKASSFLRQNFFKTLNYIF